jgi:hypothetical protein
MMKASSIGPSNVLQFLNILMQSRDLGCTSNDHQGF